MSQPLPPPAPVEGADAPSPARQGSWLAAVLPVALVAACAELGTAVLNNSTLPVYFTKGLKLDPTVMSVLMVPFFISEAVFKSPLGVLADKIGRKPLMMGGALVTVFTPLILTRLHYHPEASLALLVLFAFGVLRLMDGLGGAALWPALFAYVGDVVEEKKRGAAMGLLNVTYMVGLAFSFLAGGFVDDTFGPILTGESSFRSQMYVVGRHMRRAGRHLRDSLHHHHIIAAQAFPPERVMPQVYQPAHYYPSFYLTSILFAIAAITIEMTQQRKALTPQEQSLPGKKVTWASFLATVRTVPQFVGIAFITFFGIGCIAPIVKLFVMDVFGLTEKEVGVLVLLPMLIIGALAVPLGHLADRWGKTRAVRLGFVLSAIGLWGIPILHHLLHDAAIEKKFFVVSASIMGIGFVLAFPAWTALLTSLSGEKQRGAILGTVSAGQGIGVLLGYLVGAALYRHVSTLAPFVAAPALVTIGAVLTLIFVRERALPKLG